MTDRLSPMLAVAGQPFDSPEHLFEIKWDGIRALTEVNANCWQMWGRELADYTPRYPELGILRRLPRGTLLDGELVVFRQGRPDLPAILRRHGLTSPDKIRLAGRLEPVAYVVFDLLQLRGQSICAQPLADRRRRLADLVERYAGTQLVLSTGIVGDGQEFFAAVTAQGQEGVMAKHLASRYLPGYRSRAWQKIKPVRVIPALIIGYEPAGGTFAAVLVAAEHGGELRYIARLTSGFTHSARQTLGPLLAGHTRSKPFVACAAKATWVEPQLYCHVRFLQWTANGRLRGASFAGLLPGADDDRPSVAR